MEKKDDVCVCIYIYGYIFTYAWIQKYLLNTSDMNLPQISTYMPPDSCVLYNERGYPRK